MESARDEIHESIVRAYLTLSAQNQSALVVSQTRSEVRALNESIRAGLKSAERIDEDEHLISALESSDLTAAQKLDPRFYPEDHTLIFNRRTAGCDRGTRGRMIAVTRSGIVVEAGGKIRVFETETRRSHHGLHASSTTAQQK